MGTKFRKKPIVIEAVQLTVEMGMCHVPCPPGVWAFFNLKRTIGPNETPIADVFYLNTLEGKMSAQVGDWVLTGIRGKKYFCKDEIFKATYEEVQ